MIYSSFNDRFLKILYTSTLYREFAIRIPPHFNRVATLPCEIFMPENNRVGLCRNWFWSKGGCSGGSRKICFGGLAPHHLGGNNGL